MMSRNALPPLVPTLDVLALAQEAIEGLRRDVLTGAQLHGQLTPNERSTEADPCALCKGERQDLISLLLADSRFESGRDNRWLPEQDN